MFAVDEEDEWRDEEPDILQEMARAISNWSKTPQFQISYHLARMENDIHECGSFVTMCQRNV